jgi:hypothetical protein
LFEGDEAVKRIPDPGIFKPTPSRMETKSDATTRVAREIIDREAAARSAKTERLRAARLARGAMEAPVATTKKARQKS